MTLVIVFVAVRRKFVLLNVLLHAVNKVKQPIGASEYTRDIFIIN